MKISYMILQAIMTTTAAGSTRLTVRAGGVTSTTYRRRGPTSGVPPGRLGPAWGRPLITDPPPSPPTAETADTAQTAQVGSNWALGQTYRIGTPFYQTISLVPSIASCLSV